MAGWAQARITNATTTLTTTAGSDPDGNTISRQLQQVVNGAVQTTQTYTATVNAADWQSSTRDDGLITAYGYDAAGQPRTQSVVNAGLPVTATLNAEGLATAIAVSATWARREAVHRQLRLGQL